MASLERHQHQVAFIVDKGCVHFVDGSTAGRFTCRSVVKPREVIYGGCIGELLCTCPQAALDVVCKHLEAAVQQAPFTHAQREEAAAGLQEHLSELDVESGLLQCR
jgi:hypothetical protein